VATDRRDATAVAGFIAALRATNFRAKCRIDLELFLEPFLELFLEGRFLSPATPLLLNRGVAPPMRQWLRRCHCAIAVLV
jgi:hypothetical protein